MRFRPLLLPLLLACILTSSAGAQNRPTPTRPNVVLIYADDIGFGDFSCYGSNTLNTPNVDRLAAGGLRFTHAHTTASTCTPSRYSLLTGEYAWRRKGTGILPGDAPLIVRPGRQTLPAVFQKAGYRTGVVGKWHLGLGGPNGPDWNGEIRPGPQEVGFDDAFIMAATGDRVPTVYVENRRVVGLDSADPIRVNYAEKIGSDPTGRENPELLKMKPSHGHDMTIVNGVSRIGWMTGGNAARWTDEDMADRFVGKAVEFIRANRARPFFLYFATHDVHVPRVPHPRFAGKSGMGPRGDALLQFDWSVGEVLKTLDSLGLTQNTLVLLSSDNGPVVDDGYHDDAVLKLGNHRPAGPLRGGKGGIFEAGTRVPLLVRWPGRVKPGTSGALVSQVDFLADFAALTGQAVNAADATDSENQLSALLGDDPRGRTLLVEHARTWAITDGRWKYIEPNDGAPRNQNTNTETGNNPQPQLYDLQTDLGEKTNLASRHPEHVQRLRTELDRLKARGVNQ